MKTKNCTRLWVYSRDVCQRLLKIYSCSDQYCSAMDYSTTSKWTTDESSACVKNTGLTKGERLGVRPPWGGGTLDFK